MIAYYIVIINIIYVTLIVFKTCIAEYCSDKLWDKQKNKLLMQTGYRQIINLVLLLNFLFKLLSLI